MLGMLQSDPRMQQMLRAADVEPGDRVAAMLPNRPEAYALAIAAASVGVRHKVVRELQTEASSLTRHVDDDFHTKSCARRPAKVMKQGFALKPVIRPRVTISEPRNDLHGERGGARIRSA